MLLAGIFLSLIQLAITAVNWFRSEDLEIRFGFVELFHPDELPSLFSKRAVWLAAILTAVVFISCGVFTNAALRAGRSVFNLVEMIVFLLGFMATTVNQLIIIAALAAYLNVRFKRRAVSVGLGVLLITLAVLTFVLISENNSAPRTLLGVLGNLWAGAYIQAFGIILIVEITYQVEEWRDRL